MRRLVLVLMVGLLAAVWVVPAAAQRKCGPRTEIVTWLHKTFSEGPITRGLTGNGVVFEIFSSPAGTWTSLLSFPSGWSCINRSGVGWKNLETDPSSTEFSDKFIESKILARP